MSLPATADRPLAVRGTEFMTASVLSICPSWSLTSYVPHASTLRGLGRRLVRVRHPAAWLWGASLCLPRCLTAMSCDALAEPISQTSLPLQGFPGPAISFNFLNCVNCGNSDAQRAISQEVSRLFSILFCLRLACSLGNAGWLSCRHMFCQTGPAAEHI